MESKKSISYRIQQIIIFIIHILLLWWIYWLLQNTNTMQTQKVLLHFTGVGLYGALLIRGCAAWAKHHHLKEVKRNTEIYNAQNNISQEESE